MLVDVAHMDSAALGLKTGSSSSGSNNIIVDEYDALWSYLTTKARQGVMSSGDESSSSGAITSLLPRVDIILDNAGLELYTDLALADYLVASGLTGGRTNPLLFGGGFSW